MKALSRGISLVVVALLLLAGPAKAISVSIDDPIEGDSWSQVFYESSAEELIGSFDALQFIFGTIGGPFEVPVITGLSTAGWSIVIDTPTLVLATGPAVTHSGYFTVHFAGSSSSPLDFTFQAYNNGVAIDNDYAKWKPGWAITHMHSSPAPPQAPEPISMVMLGCLGAGMFVARKLRGKRAA
jgi:hypothetical protein